MFSMKQTKTFHMADSGKHTYNREEKPSPDEFVSQLIQSIQRQNQMFVEFATHATETGFEKPSTADFLNQAPAQFWQETLLGWLKKISPADSEPGIPPEMINFLKQSTETSNQVAAELSNMIKESPGAESLREIYKHWIECQENAYLEHIKTNAYAEHFGEFVNSLVRAKHAQDGR